MASANTLTGLIEIIYPALNVTAREQIGYIPSVTRDAEASRAAVNQTVRVQIPGVASLGNNTPAVAPPDTGGQTASYTDITITNSKHYPIAWSGEEWLSMGSKGRAFMQNEFEEAFRALSNAIEADLALSYKYASRAVGSDSADPFGTAADLSDLAAVARVLDDNGAPKSGRQVVLGAAAMQNLRGKQSTLFKVNEAGTDDLLRNGSIGRLQGFDMHDTSQGANVVKGTGAGYLVDLVAGYAVGDTTIHVDTGTGTILAGDVVTFTNDTNKYVVATGFAGDGDGDIVLAKPGLRQTLANDVAMTIGGSYAANLAFHKSSIILASRLPALPPSGRDLAVDRLAVSDPVSGLQFEVSHYMGYRQEHIEVALAWGYKPIKPEFLCILMGA